VATWAGAARATTAPAPRVHRPPVAVPRRRPAARTAGTARGIVWIAAIAVLLAGVVAMNVAVLELNVRLDKLGRERTSLRSENATLASQVSSAIAAPRIQTLAHTRLGLAPAAATDTTYIDLSRR